MKFGVTSLATKRTWRTPLMTMRWQPRMMTAVTQNYFSDNRKCLPLNLVKESSAQWKVFARLENPLRDTSPIYSEWDFSLLSSQFSRKSQLIIWACVLIFLYTLPTEAPNWLSFCRPFHGDGLSFIFIRFTRTKVRNFMTSDVLNRERHGMIDSLISHVLLGQDDHRAVFTIFPKFLDNFYTTTCCTFSTPTHWSSTSWQSRFDMLTERRAGKCCGFITFSLISLLWSALCCCYTRPFICTIN